MVGPLESIPRIFMTSQLVQPLLSAVKPFGGVLASGSEKLSMDVRHFGRSRVASIALVLAVVAGRGIAFAEQTPVGQQEPDRRPDFLFGRPTGSLGLHGSWVFARGGSDLFDFVTRQLTLDKEDFNAPGIGVDTAINLMPRLAAQFGFEWSRNTATSEYRDFTDNNLLPINQDTSLKLVHLTASVRYALASPGYEVSRFAWVPRRVVPFVGAGGGAVYYDFTQRGDFVDFIDLSVFPDTFRSKGWAPSAHVFGGVDVKLYRAVFATMEGRYTYARGKLGSDFVDFDPIDLSGFRISAGINVLY